MVLGAVFSRPWEAANKMAAGGQGRVRDYIWPALDEKSSETSNYFGRCVW